MKKIKILIAKHYLFGLIAFIVFFVAIGEIPRWYAIEINWIQWITTIISIPIIGKLTSKFLLKNIAKKKGKYFGISFFVLFISWLLLLYSKALVIGILDTLKTGRMEIIESIIGYTIYQLWIYSIFGITHGIFGGYFLAKELKNLEKQNAT